jgi:predicted Zn-dependent protease
LTNNQLESIVRNQFGHALGLPHTNNPKDIMYDTINVQHPYISECDVSALVKSYNEIMPLDDFCKN